MCRYNALELHIRIKTKLKKRTRYKRVLTGISEVQIKTQTGILLFPVYFTGNSNASSEPRLPEL